MARPRVMLREWFWARDLVTAREWLAARDRATARDRCWFGCTVGTPSISVLAGCEPARFPW